MNAHPVSAGNRLLRWRTIATVALVVVLLVPAVRDGDGVPLSSYPMYATPRPTTLEFIVPVGLDPNQALRTLSTETIASTSDPLVAESFLRDQTRLGRADALCEEILGRVDDDQIVEVQIRSERHRVIDRALGLSSLVERETLATCSAS